MIKKIMICVVSVLIGHTLHAYDFRVVVDQRPLQCTITDADALTISIKCENNDELPTTHFEIPATLNNGGKTYTVNEIAPLGFSGNPASSISIPETVTTLGRQCFGNMQNLTQVSLPENPKFNSLPLHAFTQCPQLESFVIPEGIEVLDDYVFQGCDKLKDVTFPTTLTQIGNSCFSTCGFEEMIIPETILYIGDSAFSGNYYLKKIVFHDKLKVPCDIDINLLLNTAGMDINSAIRARAGLGLGICAQCSNLTDVVIPDNWMWIPDQMFYLCRSLKEINIPENVVWIANMAFRGCKSLTDVKWGNKIMALEHYAFYDCSSLETITFPNDLELIGGYSFQNCSMLKNVEMNYGLYAIYYSAFKNCTSLPAVALPHTLQYLMEEAFLGCTALTEIDIPNSVEILGSLNGAKGSVFSGCTSLNNVRLSNSLTQMNVSNFQGCTSLTELCFPPSMEKIDGNVVSGCQNLKNVYIGLNVTDIAANAFANSGMTDLFITAQTPPAVAASSFPTSLQRLHVQREKAQNLYATTDVWKDYTEVDLLIEPDSVVILQDPAERPGAMRAATTQYNTATQIFAIQGDKFSRTATMQGENASIPHLFWKSEDPATAYVDNDGNIHVRGDLYPDTPVKVKAQSLYADMPLSEVTVLHESMSGIGDVSSQLPEGADSGATHIFTLGGIYMGTSLRGLQPGIYLIRTGNSTSKITVN